jgi:glycerate dehydrogenase
MRTTVSRLTRSAREASHIFRSLSTKPNAVFLNAGRLDYDLQLDFSRWHQLCNKVVLNRSDAVGNPEEIIDIVCDSEASIVIAKEIAVPAAVVERFPPTVKLICEAGTGYNNWPLTVARQKGIPVCNTPTYSTEAVAHMAITYLMNFSVSMFEQQRMLWENDRSGSIYIAVARNQWKSAWTCGRRRTNWH